MAGGGLSVARFSLRDPDHMSCPVAHPLEGNFAAFPQIAPSAPLGRPCPPER